MNFSTRTAYHLSRRLPIFYGWVIVGCAGCAAFVRQGAAVATLSVFVTPMSDEFGWSRTEFSGAVSLGGLLAALTAPAIGVLADRRGSGMILSVAALVLGTAALALSQTNSLIWFYIAFCIARMTFASPFDIGISSAVAQWFVRLRGQAMSYINVVFSISLAMMPVIAYTAMSAGDWRDGWLTIAIVVFTIGVAPNLLLLARRPEDIGLTPDPESARLPVDPENAAAPIIEPSFTRAQALRTPALWFIMGFTVFIFPVQAGISLHQIPHLVERGLSPLVAVSAVSSQSIVGAVSGVAFGLFARRYSARLGLCIGALAMSMSALVLLNVDHAWQAFAATSLFGFGIAGILTLLPVIWAEYYGRANFGAIRGVTLPVQVLAQASGPLIAGVLRDWHNDYSLSLSLFAGFAIAAAGLAFLARPPHSVGDTP
ncbi:MAG: MFS transporter [Rhodospirillaceae bacterium]|jgi:MFS transporter, OFA family, oxalate/formate antiporter|nr:MFS transporter [Rhodospirillaceae bacterium]MBT5666693.1 MFS transporter [Rhodospirillaceae bacterium]MBT5811961.1 MFS transporter [Rhodospirillaceae bacterium]